MQGIPGRLLVIDLVGTVLAALGFAGMFTDLSQVAPMLGNKDVAGMIAGVGCAMMTYAVLQIVRILRSRQAATGQTQEK